MLPLPKIKGFGSPRELCTNEELEEHLVTSSEEGWEGPASKIRLASFETAWV